MSAANPSTARELDVASVLPEHSPARAWAELLIGHERFTSEHPLPPLTARERAELAIVQTPSAAILACSDSRVPTETIFDRRPGEVFVIRNAGHVIEETVLGSIEFALVQLGVQLVVVLGHERCGAIAATVDVLRGGPRPQGAVAAVTDAIDLSAADLASNGVDDPGNLLRYGALHTRRTVDRILTDSPVLKNAVTAGSCAVVGAQYRLTTGAIDVLTSVGEL